ncbi:class I SAM-dependent methyltransferase [Halioxenophilus aromaticivorans]|uniref:Class I SAM-dependent methyltransferase n=1 Tax=Halioxenophilus aromaticivorans TaxID=1306992 RepID=A0AAV3U3Y0_9ALTE
MRATKKLAYSLAAAVAVSALAGAPAFAGEQADKAISKALKHKVRTSEEKARDNERKPLETLQFYGLEPDMTVIELLPGGGWYTKVLGNTLKKKGKLYVAVGASRVAENLSEWKLEDVEVLAANANMVGTDVKGIFDIENLEFDVDDVDMVLTFRNAHNLTPEARADLNAKVFAALKPGGVYGIIDHTRRHNEPYSRPVWRRLDPVLVIKEALDAGFEFEGFSDLHYQAADGLTTDTRDEGMTGPSDRFTLKFRKPQ